jgi:hypothetical protein
LAFRAYGERGAGRECARQPGAVAAENRQLALRSLWGLQSDAVSSQLVAAALRLNLRVMPSRVVVAALRNRVALTENGAQHPGQVGAFKLVAWEHVWLNKTLREAAVVDGNHQAREHVEIDLGLAADLLKRLKSSVPVWRRLIDYPGRCPPNRW